MKDPKRDAYFKAMSMAAIVLEWLVDARDIHGDPMMFDWALAGRTAAEYRVARDAYLGPDESESAKEKSDG
jgi:hypothetical protein